MEADSQERGDTAGCDNWDVVFSDLEYTTRAERNSGQIDTIWTAARSFLVLGALTKLCSTQGNDTQFFRVLKSVSGRLRAGSPTLLLGPPSCGKSVFLKALAGRLDPRNVSGKVSVGGYASGELEMQKVCSLIEQVDHHLPLVSVHDTFAFAARATGAAANNEEAHALASQMVEKLGLVNCEHTRVGNALIRGVSGGERKRTTVGEMLFAQSPVLLADEITTGLDSSTANTIVRILCDSARQSRSVALISLLQPGPEIFEHFDDVILMAEGAFLYHGPVRYAEEYFRGLGYECPHGRGVGDFLIDMTTPLRKRFFRETQGLSVAQSSLGYLVGAWQSHGLQTLLATDDPAAKKQRGVSRIDFLPANGSNNNNSNSNNNTVSISNGRSSKFYLKHQRISTSSFYLGRLEGLQVVLSRQFCLLWTNRVIMMIMLFQMSMIGVFSGLLFFQAPLAPSSPDDTDWLKYRFATLFFGQIFFSLSAFCNLPFIFEQRDVFYKHREAGMVRSSSYVIANNITSWVYCLLESSVVTALLFFLVDLVPAESSDRASVFLTCLGISMMTNTLLLSMIKTVAYAMPALVLGFIVNIFFASFIILFAGFVITSDQIPAWVVWFYWATPLSWAFRAVSVAVFTSQAFGSGAQGSLGRIALEIFEVSYEPKWITYAFVYLAAANVIFIGLQIVSLELFRFGLGSHRDVGWGKDDDRITIEHEENGSLASIVDTEEDLEGLEEEEEAGAGARLGQKRIPTSNTSQDGPRTGLIGFVRRKLNQIQPVSRAVTAQPSSVGHAATPRNFCSEKSTNGEALELLPIDFLYFSFRDICYTVSLKGKKKTKQLLDKVSGFARPGTATALMGPTGAGKTTLLDVVAGRKTSGTFTGRVLVNGRALDRAHFQRAVGYVQQEDIHSAAATVREAVYFSAKLRNPHGTPEKFLRRLTHNILNVLRLQSVANIKIGVKGVGRGLAVHEFKRLTVAVELAAQPSILFLDEPTSGLSSIDSEIVMGAVRAVALAGRTVICTIHQPSREVFLSSFDNVLLLQRGGKLVYNGPARAMLGYFEKIPGVDSLVPAAVEYYNPASLVLDLLGAHFTQETQPSQSDGDPETEALAQNANFRPIDFAKEYLESSLAQSVVNELERIESESAGAGSSLTSLRKVVDVPGSSLPQAPTSAIRVEQVTLRWMRTYWRSPSYNLMKAGIMTLINTLLGLTVYQNPIDGPAEVQSFMGMSFFSLLMLGFLSSITCLPVLFSERAVFLREKHANMYSASAYTFGSTCAEIPYVFVSAWLSFTSLYLLAGYRTDDWRPYVQLFFTSYMLLLTMTFSGHLMSSVAPNLPLAIVGSMSIMSFFSLFCGFVISPEDMGDFGFLANLAPPSYLFSAVANTQLICSACAVDKASALKFPNHTCNGGLACNTACMGGERPGCDIISFPTPNGFYGVTVWEYTKASFGVQETNWLVNFGAIAACMVFFRVLDTLLLSRKH